jgi:hypothetical protein
VDAVPTANRINSALHACGVNCGEFTKGHRSLLEQLTIVKRVSLGVNTARSCPGVKTLH